MAFRFDRLKALRKEKGYKQVTLARDLHIGRSTLAMWETGQSEPSTEMCSRLAELLGCSVGYLMGTEDEINAQRRLAVLPQVRTVLGAYDLAATPAERNALLRTVLDHITYTKTQRCQRNNAPTDHLSLTLFPRVTEACDEDFSARNSGSMV